MTSQRPVDQPSRGWTEPEPPSRNPDGYAQSHSGSAAGSLTALPLDIVVQLEAGLAWGLHGALLQLPVGQG